jgi:uncharacterized protein (TIGR02145 family)
MRKLILTTAAVAVAIGLAGCGKTSTPNMMAEIDTVTGILTDKRDGAKYRTTVIDGKRWMAQNLNYQTKRGSWCYNDNADNCDKYGKLYDWKTARTVCPTGYHLPPLQEWIDLVTVVGGKDVAEKMLKARNGWNKNDNGTDNYGFSALPSGHRGIYGNFYGGGDDAVWWTATITEARLPIGYRINDVRLYFDSEKIVLDNFATSVRCVADNP